MTDDFTRDPEVIDSLYQVLANQRRRQVIRLLAERDDPMTVAELANRMDSAEGPDIDSSDRDRSALELHHSSLPMMDDASVVEYDGEEWVALTPLGRTAADVTKLVDIYLHG